MLRGPVYFCTWSCNMRCLSNAPTEPLKWVKSYFAGLSNGILSTTYLLSRIKRSTSAFYTPIQNDVWQVTGVTASPYVHRKRGWNASINRGSPKIKLLIDSTLITVISMYKILSRHLCPIYPAVSMASLTVYFQASCVCLHVPHFCHTEIATRAEAPRKGKKEKSQICIFFLHYNLIMASGIFYGFSFWDSIKGVTDRSIIVTEETNSIPSQHIGKPPLSVPPVTIPGYSEKSRQVFLIVANNFNSERSFQFLSNYQLARFSSWMEKLNDTWTSWHRRR